MLSGAGCCEMHIRAWQQPRSRTGEFLAAPPTFGVSHCCGGADGVGGLPGLYPLHTPSPQCNTRKCLQLLQRSWGLGAER